MAYNDDQNESPLPTGNGSDKRSASDLIPKFFRSEANRKFLQGTIDQLIQPGQAEKLSGYVGRKTAKSYRAGDNYIGDVTSNRESYQLEPAAVIKDNLNNVTFYKDYNDYIGTLNYFGANTANQSRLNETEYYSWNPNINWDTFTNFREYYWVPEGPISIPVRGQSKDIVSTYKVTTEDQGDNIAYVFNDGLTRNPSLKLYRGQKYRFEIDTPGHPMAISISRSFTPGASIITAGTAGLRADGLFDATLYDANDSKYDMGEFIILPSSGSVSFADDDNVSTLYPDGIVKIGEEGEEVATAYIEKGVIEFTIPLNAPGKLYYISKNEIDTSGIIRIYDIEENTFLDVENEILGKKDYLSANGVQLSNGMKISFQGDITPAKYEQDQWYVEGVGDSIVLINERDLVIPAAYSENKLIPYDSDKFDNLPFANASAYANDKDYIIINRASQDKNAWSRYNKWFHKDVLIKSYELNNLPIDINEEGRAKRPIIEFEAGLKLFNYGVQSKTDIDLVDVFTKDVFSTIEGEQGYNVDGIALADGMRVLFTADTDIRVTGKIYQVKFVTINNIRQISLVETNDTDPLQLQTVFVTQGKKYSGQTFHYHSNNVWTSAQEKTKINQPPLFDLCSSTGDQYSNLEIFDSSTFIGSKVFSYKEGDGVVDSELGFPLSYKTIENTGDIVFNFDLMSDEFTIQSGEVISSISTSTAFLKKYKGLTDFEYINGWSNKPTTSKQYVVRQYTASQTQLNDFSVDVFDNAADLNDLKVIVFVNHSLKTNAVDYDINRIDKSVLIRFKNNLSVNDIVTIKAHSATVKNNNGYYELPINLERNPLNENIGEFTLGEVNDHVGSIVEEIPNFLGVFPGNSNLRDMGDADPYGKRFVKHASPLNLSLYHVTSKDFNIVKALDYANNEYSKFKRVFLETAESLGFDGPIKQHVDKVLQEVNKDKIKSQPFYFSDMLAYGPYNRIEYKILDARIQTYALTNLFTLTALTEKAVYVYLNQLQLTHEVDYTFSDEGYLILNANQQDNDILEIYEFQSTDGSFIPPTPTKLGLFPKYAPELTIDDTYITSEPTTTGPYKIYGEVSKGFNNAGTRGWFYPVFTTAAAAKNYSLDAGNDGEIHTHQFVGLNRTLYMPNTGGTHGGLDNIELDAYPVGIPLIKGHDGSYIRAYLDFRDDLLLDFENRIFNNIKIDYKDNAIDIDAYIGGEFRKNKFTNAEINSTLLGSFTNWLKLVDNDYTDNTFYNRLDPFTFNYSNALSANNNPLPGFWRGIYKYAFDTDRPHSHPWEILGFKIKPDWFDTVYGPAPYTGNNLVLWRDIEQGKIADPINVRYDTTRARPGILGFIPADEEGKLKNPQQSGFIRQFILRQSVNNFKFGDQGPVETAWRRSSQYPFAVIKSMLLNQPSKTMAEGFDLSRVKTNLAGQKVYTATDSNFKLSDIVFPNTYADNTRILTSGLINYIYNLVASDVLTVYQDYQNNLKGIKNQLGFKLGGFTDKQKLNLILDSRNPQQQLEEGGIYVPQENYQIIFNTSSPQQVATYSGVVIEKKAIGYTVRGYNNDNPYFEYYEPIPNTKSVPVTVGGITEATTMWAERKLLVEDTIVEHQNNYYRVTDTFTSGETFNTTNLAKLPEIPVVGGKTVFFKRNFDASKPTQLAYGTSFTNSQDVVDFLLGYGKRLIDLGFDFNYVEEQEINNWDQAAKEFVFWTTQGWSSGTVITISPAANKFNFKKDYYVVDDLNDKFYPYSVLTANGLPLDSEFSSLYRDENSFGIQTVNTTEGLYSAILPLVQKEHVVLLDNKTVFNDIIFQPYSGYRQERIKLSGYRADNWNGGLNIPGFVFDDAKVTDWQIWKDYVIGSLVKYKQYYYVATSNVPGSSKFETTQWHRLSEKPESELVTNFDYRINQITDFYSLDTQGFDAELQKMAKHLTGFQKRQYLANIIPDDVSQYKFYQGMIQEKGTENALTKLFGSLSSAGENSLEFYEEWALQVGRFGSVDKVKHVEFNFKQEEFTESPQVVELVNVFPETNYEKFYRILPYQVYNKPADYNHAPFKTKPITDEYVKSGGFVREDDVTFVAGTKEELSTGDVNLLGLGDYIWVNESGENPWDVFQHIEVGTYVSALTDTQTINDVNERLYDLTIERWAGGLVQAGDIVGIRSANEYELTGLYIVDKINLNKITIRIPGDVLPTGNFIDEKFLLTKLRSVRVLDIDAANKLAQERVYPKQRFWIENYVDNNWAVLENNSKFSKKQDIVNNSNFEGTLQQYSNNIVTTSDNKNLFISGSAIDNGKIEYYRRTNENWELKLDQEILPFDTIEEWKPNKAYKARDLALYDADSTRTYWRVVTPHTSGDQFSDSEISSYWVQETNPFTYYDPVNANFGASVDVSEDGEYLIIGSPNASKVKTRFLGNFDPDATYNKNDIVRYRESLWKANREILPQIQDQPYSTFDSYINLVEQENSDSTSLTLIVAGDPGLENSIVDHLLVRAPKDMYNGTAVGDGISLYWNQRSFAYPTLDTYLPFDNNIPEITSVFLSQEHIIQEKIDNIFFIDAFVTLPVVGDVLETDTGSGEVAYISTKGDSAVIYIKNSNGLFTVTGEMFNDRGDFVGFYTEENTFNTTDAVAGYFLIKTFNIGSDAVPQTTSTTSGNEFTYSNNSSYYDVGRGLVYADVRTIQEISDNHLVNLYDNIQDTIADIGPYVLNKNQASFIQHLSFLGDNNGIETARPSSKFVIRTSKSYGNEIQTRFNNAALGSNVTANVKIFDNPDYDFSLSSIEQADINGEKIVEDLWDGYIDFDFTEFDFQGNVFEPVAKYYIDNGVWTENSNWDTIQDVQIPRDGQGGLARTTTNTSTAEIMYYQRNFNSVRVYVKVTSGSWEQLTNIGKFQVQRLSNEDIRGVGDPNQLIGTVVDTNNDIAIGTNFVGKLLLIDAGRQFDSTKTWDLVSPVIDQEYFFFNENIITGIDRLPNPPTSINKDYTQVYNIEADNTGTPGPINQGAINVYARNNVGLYELQTVLVSEYAGKDKQFGSKVKITQNENSYKLLVSNKPTSDARNEPFEWRTNPGSIEIYNHGVRPTDNFKGEYQINRIYYKDEIVVWRDNYYKANKTTLINDDQIQNRVYWNKISWSRSKDSLFRGTFDNTYGYRSGSIVEYNGLFWSATTNISAGADAPSLLNTAWNDLNTGIDYLGYLPNLGVAKLFEETYDPVSNIEQFASEFDVSKLGDVLVVTSRKQLADSTFEKDLAIYRLTSGKYILNQIIKAPASSYALQNHDLDSNTPDVYVDVNRWAETVSINPAGNKIAVSVPFDDTITPDQGAVWIYDYDYSTQQFGSIDGEITTPTTIINSPNNEEVERFGHSLMFSDNSLVISSMNGDQLIPTRFDTFENRLSGYVLDTSSQERTETTFDNKFTSFKNAKLDKGTVYVYENLENSLIYSEQLIYKNAKLEFGRNILANDNHIYIGIPNQIVGDKRGVVLDYRKPKNTTAWNTIRSSNNPVDISKIDGIFLYNKRQNEIVSYIDYIDPIQGKIAGVADQEITYKVPNDPAKYNVGDTVDQTVDPASTWQDTYVGQVWWNLSTARFSYPYQGSPSFQKTEWNRLLPGASIDVYEWVESDFLPEQWDELADTDNGVPLGISGRSLYGNSKYSARLEYDELAQAFSTKYYFWVSQKSTIPNKQNRNISIQNIASLIAAPRQNGYRFVSLLNANTFVLNNFENLITSDDLVLNIKYRETEDTGQLEHKQYQILSDGLATSKPNVDIERKWIDSLIGADTNNRPVPDLTVPVGNQIGIQNTPRQSMFVNRIEALKQAIERINLVLSQHIIVDEYNLNSLTQSDPQPTLISQKYDSVIDTFEELTFVSTNKISKAELTPIIVNGKIVRVIVDQAGRGYKVPPSYQFEGPGSGAEIDIIINNLGQITSVEVLSQGDDYTDDSRLSVREFTVLVKSDSTAFNKWATYAWNATSKKWARSSVQSYNVTAYWNYVDWYAEEYNQFTNIDYRVSNSYELPGLNDSIGSVVKIDNVGSGGWLLLKKVDSQDTEDYTINYNTIGRQNGTIQFLDNLYDFNKNTTGFDNKSYDSFFYDNNPNKELRIIFETLRDNIFTTDLEIEYNQLFFSSLRYVLSEQPNVDWMFKTSFISATHKLGQLQKDTTFQYNNLNDFESYVKEVKPYSVNIREFVDNYTNIENTLSSVSDFDNAPYFDKAIGNIVPSSATISENTIVGDQYNTTVYPRKYWRDNLGYQITEIKISNSGSGYTFTPTVTIEGGGGTGATAKAVLGYGKITSIIVTNPGNGYTSAPTLTIAGPRSETGTDATATAILGNGLVRAPHIRVKFDRLSGEYTYETIQKQTIHTGTNFDTVFELPYPMDLNNDKVSVFINNNEQLRSKYTYKNIKDTVKTYTRERGQITFVTPPALDAIIEIKYQLPLSMLHAEDRILHSYNPLADMYGKELTQLMTGIDYGGVEVRSYEFKGVSGWDSDGWYLGQWDEFDDFFEDEIFTSDGSTIAVQLSKPLEAGVTYNVYRRAASDTVPNPNPFVRLDDPNFGTEEPEANSNAIIQTITGDGTTTIIQTQDLGIELSDGDVFIVRKTTSDGSILPDTNSYDTQLSGGDLNYTTATGTNAEDIITDGDGFISAAASAGPEELVPGQIFDTLDIKVYTRESGGQGQIYSQSYRIDTNVTTYDLGVMPGSADSVFVKIDNTILSEANNDYTIDWKLSQVTINNSIASFVANASLSIITVAQAGQNILDFDNYIADGSTVIFETRSRMQEDTSVFVSVNGVKQTVTTSESSITGNIQFEFDTAPAEDAAIYYVVFSNSTTINYSQMKKDVFTGTGTQTEFIMSEAPLYAKPTQHNVIVKVGNSILSPGYNIQYTIPSNNQREYLLETFQMPSGSLLTDDVVVYLNGQLITVANLQWRFDISNSSVVLADDVGKPGDLVEIYVITDGEYQFTTLTPPTVQLNSAPAVGQTVEIMQFTNHDILEIERINYDVVSRITIQADDINYNTYQRLTVGEITLRKPAIDAKYVWVIKNGTLLTPEIDYTISESREKVILTNYPDANDVIDVFHFTATANTAKFAFRQFKDILNRTHFKRLDSSVTKLSQDLNYYDLRIEVEDASELAEPNKPQNLPGILFVNGERIEYFVKDGNTLRQLRRGTLGTGIRNVHTTGSNVFDQNIAKTIPYRDTTIVQNHIADGTLNVFDVDNPTSTINELEVFVGGKRMRKNIINEFLPVHELDSPEGDLESFAEVVFDISTQQIELKYAPAEGTQVTIIKKQGKIWNDAAKPLGESENSIARFLRAGTSELPE